MIGSQALYAICDKPNVGLFITTWLANCIPMYAAERQTRRIRSAYMKAMLRQDMAWYDTHRPGEIATRMAEESLAVQEGLGEKPMQALTFVSTFVAGLVIAFIASAKMTGVMIAFLPFMALIASQIGAFMSDTEKGGQDAYARAGDAASEVRIGLRSG